MKRRTTKTRKPQRQMRNYALGGIRSKTRTKTRRTTSTLKKLSKGIHPQSNNRKQIYNKILHSKHDTYRMKYDKIVKLSCSPTARKKHKKQYSCLSDDILYKLKNMWNERHPDAQIHSKNPEEIWKMLKQNMSNVCNKESCWLKQDFTKGQMNHLVKDEFAPESPDEWKKNPNEWLSSVDIINVMKQYETAYKCFNFMGPSPIDYDTRKVDGECVWNELCNLSLKQEMRRGIYKIGIIFNLDPHYKSGSHWVSLFIDIKKGKIFFFDSAGDKVPKQIKKLSDNIIEQGKQLHPPIQFNFDENHPKEHQFGDTECGIYSLFFIIHMLEDKIDGNYLKKNMLNDKFMEKFRQVYFNADL